MYKRLANNNLLPPVVMVAIDTSNHLTVACLEIHWSIPAIHKASLSAAGSDMILYCTAGEFPPAILTFVIMVALHSRNVLVCRAHKVHGDIKVIDIARFRASCCIAMADDISALPTP